jgi:hypothetical protein
MSVVRADDTGALLSIGFRVSVASSRVARGASRRDCPALNRSTGTLILRVIKALATIVSRWRAKRRAHVNFEKDGIVDEF